MAPSYKIALIQLYPQPLEPEKNFAKAAEFVVSAARKGAQLAVLPEYHLTNWVPDDPSFMGLCADWEKYVNKYKALAKEHKICIVPGTIMETFKDEETGEDQLHNIAYFIDHNGEVLGRYQKKNLWHPERPHLTSSTEDPHLTFSTPIGPVGMLICWDLAFPEAFRELIAAGAKTIIIPTFWTLADCSPYGLAKNPLSEKLFLETTLTARAYENTCAVVFVNAGAPPGDIHHRNAGLSRVAMPFVGALGDETKDTAAEGMSVVDVDMEIIEEAEQNYKVREDIAGENWHYTYRHQAK
ncbi:hypothetical protein P7C71_g2565, partial [Lecanoromycetidae sp. Uapishka_2]